jgi:pimeloyl-ACP methyl ester carboxylesterase
VTLHAVVGQSDDLVASADDHPALSLVEAERGVASVRPHSGTAGRAQLELRLGKQTATDAGSLVARLHGHATQLPPATVPGHEGCDSHDDLVAVRLEERREVEGPRQVVDVEAVVRLAIPEHVRAQLVRAGSIDPTHRYRSVVAGPTPPVLLAHGFASSFHDNWRRTGFVDLLEDAGRTVLPFDFLGHGTSPKPHDSAAYTDLVGNLAEALPSDGSPVDAVGFSMGAGILLELAARVPERFRRLVVAGVGENLFEPPETKEMAAAIERGSADPEQGRTKLFVQFATRDGNDPQALVALLRRPNPRRHDAATLARVTCSTLVVIGDQDHAGSPKPLVDALPDATLVVLRNTEHFGTPKSIGFIDAALDFLLAD